MPVGKRRDTGAVPVADASLARCWGSARAAPASSIGTPETLGAEWGLFHALAWRRLLSAERARRSRSRRLRLDALPPPSLVREPGLGGGSTRTSAASPDKIAPLRWSAGRATLRRASTC